MFEPIKIYCESLLKNFSSIGNERKLLLENISGYVDSKIKEGKPANLIYICTHNSRRSHFGQIWAHIASIYYNLPEVNAFSGGTEITAFNINAINALKRIGFLVNSNNAGNNPVYNLVFDEKDKPVTCYSKLYNSPENPSSNFAAIMTCSDAEQNCPFIPSVDKRIGTPYEDPKIFDNTSQQDEMYSERCRQIAIETFYAFSRVNSA